jgi:tRNA nucleotidyltransferase (CCA-adding enzyme)
VRFAVMAHDFGKGRTPRDQWPSHPGHEELGVEPIDALCARLKVPRTFRDLAVIVSRYHTHVHRAPELKPGTLLGLLEDTDALRRPERFYEFLSACECDARGRLGLEDRAYPQSAYLRAACEAAGAVTLSESERQGLSGSAFGERLRVKRLEALTQLKASAGTFGDRQPTTSKDTPR